MSSKDATAPIGSLDDASSELDHAIDELRGVLKEGAAPPRATAPRETTASSTDGTMSMKTASPAAFADFGDIAEPQEAPTSARAAVPASDLGGRMDVVMDIPIDVQIVLGSSRMPVSALMNLSEGATIALDRKIGEPVEITVNGRIVGHGEITVLEGDDTRFGIRLIDMLAPGKD